MTTNPVRKALIERKVTIGTWIQAGVRGYAFTRGNDWGRTFPDYAANANDDIAVGIDTVFIGEGAASALAVARSAADGAQQF